MNFSDQKCNIISGNYNNIYFSVAPSIISSLTSTVVFTNEGGSAALHCVVQGRPHPQIHWYHGNTSIATPNVHYGPLHNGTLLIYQATSEMTGAYTCEVENSAGKAKAPMRLVIRNN